MKKIKLFTLGMVLCLSFAMLTGCGRDNNADNNQTNDNTATEDADTNRDNTDKNNTDNNNGTASNPTTTGTASPTATDGTNVGEDLVDTVDNVGTDIVDGVTDVGRDLTGDDGTGNNASTAPATATP